MCRLFKKKILFIFMIIAIFLLCCSFEVYGKDSNDNSENTQNKKINNNSIYAKYAAVTDKDTNRLLYGKQSDVCVPMASTTKIMTLIIALENADSDFTATCSPYAASMPDVQLNAVSGQQFKLKDLYYSLMLRSHNDTAVIIAENTSYYLLCKAKEQNMDISYDVSFIKSFDYNSEFLKTISKEQSKILVKIFTDLMNKKAKELGCEKTHYITPNGLDAADETGIHSTTAYELCKIMSYCIDNPLFLSITQTKQHTFSDINKKRTYCVNNANTFLSMYPGIISGKTGFTNDAGYCYVCACNNNGNTFIVSLLACGWPNNKTYKWKDSKLLLDYVIENYSKESVISDDNIYEFQIQVLNGNKSFTKVHFSKEISSVISKDDDVQIKIDVPESTAAPVVKGSLCTTAEIYVNDYCIGQYPVYYEEQIEKNRYFNFFIQIFHNYLL